MIESRYSIEYVDPNATKPRSRLGRLVAYTLLINAVLIMIGALVFTSFSEKASDLILGKIKEFSNISFVADKTPKTDATPEQATTPDTAQPLVEKKPLETANKKNQQDTFQQKLSQQTAASTQRDKDNKEEIERLSQENSKQHDETLKQVTANKELMGRLDDLSKQLKAQNVKSEKLAQKVDSLESHNKSLVTQLEDSKNLEAKLEVKKEEEEEKITAVPIQIEPATKTVIVPKKVQEQATNPVTKTEKEVVKEEKPPQKAEPKKSQVDDIVAAMEAAQKSNTTK